MSNATGFFGFYNLLTHFVFKTLSPTTALTRFPNVSFWTVRSLTLLILDADGFANFGG